MGLSMPTQSRGHGTLLRCSVCGGASLELDLGNLTDRGGFGGIELEELRRTEAEHARDHVGRETHQCSVVLADRVVVVLAREADAVLRRGQLFLQRKKALVRLEIGVRL